MSAALQFQEQVKRGDLQDSRRRGGRRGGVSNARGDATLPMPRAAPGYGRSVTARNPPSYRANSDWGSNLATRLPDRFYIKNSQPTQSTAANNNPIPGALVSSSWAPAAVNGCNPMVVEPQAPGGLASSVWVSATDNNGTRVTGEQIPRGLGSSAWAVPSSDDGGNRVVINQQTSSGGLAGSSWAFTFDRGVDPMPIGEPASGGLAGSAWADTPVAHTPSFNKNLHQTGPSVDLGGASWGTSLSNAAPVASHVQSMSSQASVNTHTRIEPQRSIRNVATGHATVMEETSLTKAPLRTLKDSRWAKPAAPPSVDPNIKYPPHNPVFGVDQGPYRDDNWLYTYHTEDGGRIYRVTADNAAAAGDLEAENALRIVAQHAREIVEARIGLRDSRKEDEARARANHTADLAKRHFNKYHPPLPVKPQRYEDMPQSAPRPSQPGRGVHSAAADPGYVPFGAGNTPKKPLNPAAKSFVGGGLEHKQEASDQPVAIQQPAAQLVQQQGPTSQSGIAAGPVTSSQRLGLGQSSDVPFSLDHPTGRELFESWMHKGDRK